MHGPGPFRSESGTHSAASVEVDRIRMVHDDRSCGLLGDELVGGRELEPELRHLWQQPQNELVLLKVGAGWIAPRVPPSLLGFEAQLDPDPAMDELRQTF